VGGKRLVKRKGERAGVGGRSYRPSESTRPTPTSAAVAAAQSANDSHPRCAGSIRRRRADRRGIYREAEERG
jgi:hypothetical protein